MPQFILDSAGTVENVRVPLRAPADIRYDDLDDFTQGYVQALFFTESEPGTLADAEGDESLQWDPETQSSLPGDASFADLDPDTLAAIVSDCATFKTQAQADLDTVDGYEFASNGATYSEEQAGMDFWYTRNHHGVGFWDRFRSQDSDTMPEVKAAFDRLSDLASAKGETWSTYGDDGKVYLS